MLWIALWTFPLVVPLTTITSAPAAVGLAAFEAGYVYTAGLGFDAPGLTRTKHVLLGAVAALGVALALGYGEQWLIVLLYVSCCGAAVYGGEQRPVAAAAVLAASLAAIAGIGLARGAAWWTIAATLVGTALSSLLIGAVRQMGRLIFELRRTREALAEAAVAEERLRFSRDLHDLLGHTLSVVVLKAQVARRLAERDPAAAAAQAAEIEDVGRRALVEIREAVTGYRESGLTAELARAEDALSAAGITAKVLHTAGPLPEPADRLLAWVVREATTNVVRHSGARTCAIEVTTDDGAVSVRVADDGGSGGPGPAASHGNGLRGLTERLGAAGGTLATGPRPGGGFTLTATLPLAAQPQS